MTDKKDNKGAGNAPEKPTKPKQPEAIKARVLSAFWHEEAYYEPNDIFEADADTVMGYADEGKIDPDEAAVAFAEPLYTAKLRAAKMKREQAVKKGS